MKKLLFFFLFTFALSFDSWSQEFVGPVNPSSQSDLSSAPPTRMPPSNKKFVELEWEAVPGAVKYELEILSLKTKRVLKAFSSKTNIFKLNVKFGKYLVRSRIFDIADTASPWSETTELLIAPPPLAILTHSNPSVPIQAKRATGLGEVKIEWESQEGVPSYKLLVETNDGTFVKEVKTTTNWARVLLPTGNYKFRVVAILPDESETEAGPYSDEFNIIGAEIDPPKVTIIKKKGGFYIAQVEALPPSALLWGQLEYLPLEGTVWKVVQEYKGVTQPVIDFQKLTPGNYKFTIAAKAEKFTDSKSTVVDFLVKPILPDLEKISAEITQAISGKPAVEAPVKK